MAKTIKQSSRYLAMEALCRIENNQAYSNLELKKTIDSHHLSRSDANLLTQLVYGVTQRKLSLDYFLSPYVKDQKLEGWVRQLLRLSVYQAIYLDRIPDHAITNEAVNIAKVKGHAGVAKMVNAVLRNVQRHPLLEFDAIQDDVERLSIQYSLSTSIVEVLIQDYGSKKAEEICQAFLEPSYASVRVNDKFITRDEAMSILENEGFQVEESPLSPVGIRAKQGVFSESSLFKSGKITIQDESSMLVAEALSVEADHQVLDACAAPGGKATHIANYLDAEAGGFVYATDIHQHKIKLIEENVARQNFESVVHTRQMDAKHAGDVFEEESFDRILVDAPCSGIGLLKRKPDIRYTKTKEDFQRLQAVQLDIMLSLAPLLKKGGRLVYSTCTIIKKENEELIDLFLEQASDYQLAELRFKNIPEAAGTSHIKILPQDYGTDGFFICALEKE